MIKAILLAVAAPAWVLPAAGVAAPDDAETTERLLRGEIVVTEATTGARGAAGRLQMLVDAPARAVWDVIVSCELAFAFVNGLERCEVLEDSGGRALVHQVVDQGWWVPTYDFVFESLRRRYQRIDVRLVEGNLRSLSGYWAFEEGAEGTVVDYQIAIQPLLPAPGFIVRRNIREGMPDMLACIRALADGSGSAVQERADLVRCAGPLPAGRTTQ